MSDPQNEMRWDASGYDFLCCSCSGLVTQSLPWFLVCGRCMRLGKLCESGMPTSRIEQLQQKILELESQIDAFGGSDSGSRRASAMSSTHQKLLQHPLFSQSADGPSRPPRVLPIFPHPIWADRHGDEAFYESREVYTSVISRDVVEAELGIWDPRSEVPRRLAEYLLVLS